MAGFLAFIGKAVAWWKGLGAGTQLYFAATALSASYQVYQARVARRDLEDQRREAAIQELRLSASGQVVPILYGFTYTNGAFVFADISSKLPEVPAAADNVKGELEVNTEGKNNEYLLHQHVLSAGHIDSFVDLWLDEKRVTGDDATLADVTIAEFLASDTASSMATAFCAPNTGNGTEHRTAAATFTDMSYVTIVNRLNVDNPKFANRPYPDFFVKGRRIRSIAEESLGGESFGRTVPRVLLDYLTNEDYGAGLSDDDIDLESFAAAEAIASTTVAPPEPMENSTGMPNASAEPFYRYTYDGHVPTSEEHGAAILKILEHMPGAILFRSADGKYRLSVQDSITRSENQSLGTIDDNLLIRSVEIIYPDSTVKLNRMTATFSNVMKDYAQDSIVYPLVGSALESDYRQLDNDVVLEENVQLSGCIDPYHASAICANRIAMSRRTIYRFETSYSGFIYEPGDVVLLEDSVQELSAYVRIQSVKPREDGTIAFEALQFVPGDAGWYGGSRQRANKIVADEGNLDAPTNLTGLYQSRERLVNLGWTAPDPIHALQTGYEIEVKIDDGPWLPLGTVLGAQTNYSAEVGVLGTRRQFRVRSVGRGIGPSDWVESLVFVIPPVVVIDNPFSRYRWNQFLKTEPDE